MSGCAVEDPGEPPPKDRFSFPVSVALVEPTPGTPGVLYVVSSNFDLRYNRGTVLAVDLSKLSSLEGPVAGAVDPEAGWAYIDSFGGMVGAYAPAGAGPAQRTLFVPTRADNRLYGLRADGPRLSCFTPPEGGNPQDCLNRGLRLAKDGLVKAQDPFATAFDGSALYVSHLRRSDDYPTTGTSYLARLDAETMEGLEFINLDPAGESGAPPAQALAMTPVGLYVSGRALTTEWSALRTLLGGQVQDAGLSAATGIREARGLGLSSDGTRLYVATRGPDATQSATAGLPEGSGPDGILVLDVSRDPLTGRGRNRVLGFTGLPKGPSEIKVIPRPGMRDLVAVGCTNADAVAFYDDEVGALAAVVSGITEPFGMALGSRPGGGARLYVASFGNDTVDVIDLADPSRPREAARVGRLGVPHQAEAAALEATP